MSEVAAIFSERKRASALAAELRCPKQTVYSWKHKGYIPPWRRAAVLAAIGRLGFEVPPTTIAYLAKAEA